MTQHLRTDEIQDFVVGLHDAVDLNRLRFHLKECGDCSEALAKEGVESGCAEGQVFWEMQHDETITNHPPSLKRLWWVVTKISNSIALPLRGQESPWHGG